jgi:hypothetical protein
MPRSPTAVAPGGDQPGADCVRHLEAARTGIVLDRMVGPGLGESPPTDPASGSASARCMPPTTPSMAMNRLPMIFSCGDRKPSDHLGIDIPRIGLPLFGLWIPG